MTTATRQLLDQAIALDPTERAQLVEAILNSFSPGVASVDAAWRAEADRRFEAWHAGALDDESVGDVLQRINRGRDK
jgi:putative addiction module component (TIGR02574 family)